MANNTNLDTIAAAALDYHRRGFNLVLLKSRSKQPVHNEWPSRPRLTEAEIPAVFSNGYNAGLQQGPASKGLVDTEFDSETMRALAPRFMPPTRAIFGRPGKPRSHWLYLCPELHDGQHGAVISIKDADGGEIGSLRIGDGGKGAQSMVPPSIHPSGERVEWADGCEPEPAEVGAELELQFRLLAVATLLADHWPRGEGNRNSIANATAGWLAMRELTEEQATEVVSAAAEYAGDDEIKSRRLCVRDTYRKFEKNEKVTGWPTLTKLIDGKAAKALKQVLAVHRPDPRAVIILKIDALNTAAAAAEDALVTTGKVFKQDTQLVRFVYEEEDASKGRKTTVARIRPYSLPLLQCELLEVARCIKFNAEGEAKPADVPDRVLNMMLDRASPKFSELVGIIETQTMRPNDGTLLTKSGYDAATGLMLVNPPQMNPIPEHPTRADAERALALLDDLLAEFPFADEPSRAVALSELMTPVLRAAMEHAPIHENDAPQAGSGKSYLQEVASYIATGKLLPVLNCSSSGQGDRLDIAELEKRLAGSVLSGQSIICIDNIPNGAVLSSALLCQAVSEPLLEVRPLGRTGNLHVRSVATVFINGNNIEVAADLIRRTLKCRMEPAEENPETRTFRTPYPHQKVLADRGKFVAAVLTVARAHLVAGCPGATLVTPYAGFEEWSRLVREPLLWLGKADPVATQEGLRQEDPAVTTLDAVIGVWEKGQTTLNPNSQNTRPYIPSTWLTANELVGINNYDPLYEALREATRAREGEPTSAARVGTFLKKHHGRVRNGVKLVSWYDSHAKVHRWRLEFLKERKPAEASETQVVVPLPTKGRKATKKVEGG